MENKITIDVKNNKGELIIRTGPAAPAREKNPVVIENGLITAPGMYYCARKNKNDEENHHVRVNKDKGEIILIMDEDNPLFNRVCGSIYVYKNLENFEINTDNYFEPAYFAKIFKRFKHYFDDKKVNAELVTALKNYKAKVTKDVEIKNDDRGNYRDHRDRHIEMKIPENFKLKMPIIEGEKEKVFTVDIGIDEKNDKISIYLISSDLEVMSHDSKSEILERELKIFEDIPIIFVG